MNSHAAPKLASERVVIAAPMSLAGSAARIWKMTGITRQPVARFGLGTLALVLVVCVWALVLAWYFVFGLFLVPYRITRRGQRKRKREALIHREQLDLIRATVAEQQTVARNVT